MKRQFKAIVFLLTMTFQAQAQQPVDGHKGWAHESEASLVSTSGNSESESYSAKQMTKYQQDLNLYTLRGRYLRTKTAAIETANSWDASLRYERELTDQWSLFVQHGAEGDSFAGYVQRDNADLGGKYYFVKSEPETLAVEAGLRAVRTLPTAGPGPISSNSGRLFGEYSRQINTSVSGKFWVEYLPDLKNQDAYLVNYEPSVTVMMSQILSLKVAYLVKFHNDIATPTEKKTDTTMSTALVAKF